MKRCLIGLLCAATSFLQAKTRDPLTLSERTNGAQTLAAVEALARQIRDTVAVVVDSKNHLVASATWVGGEGYFLTKASDVPQLQECRIKWALGQSASVREIHRSAKHDLVLAQAVGVTGVHAVTFSTKSVPTSYGQWLAAPVKGGTDLRIGVVSAQRRVIKGAGAAIGVRMDESPLAGKGVRIVGVAEDSPAEKAGLRKDDVLLMIGDQVVASYNRVTEIIRHRMPGEQIEVQYRRDGQEAKAQVRLASRSKILQNWDGEDFANGGISIRTDNFAQVIQHDVPLSAQDMGSPLIDLNGNALGINIARVDRITTFALPADVFWDEFRQYLENDRYPPKAQKP